MLVTSTGRVQTLVRKPRVPPTALASDTVARNKMLQGDVVLKYFVTGPFSGRGGVVRNLLYVHDIQFEENNIIPGAAWPEEKERLITSGENPIGTLPVLYIGDKPYFGHLPAVRYLAAKFDAVSSDPEVRYCSDVVMDEYNDYITKRKIEAAFTNEEEMKEFIEKRKKFYALIEKLYNKRPDKSTPFFMGLEKPGYDDVAIFTMMYDDSLVHEMPNMEAYPTLEALYEKITEIPRIKEWMKEASSKPVPFS